MTDIAGSNVETQGADALTRDPSPEARVLPLRFTGSGGEYFRIWIVNLLLTILTLGIYSAWAKVRKTRYFYANTQLDGSAFQYHGNPGAILRGRILAAVIFGAYSVAGRISVEAAIVAIVLLGVLAPWLFYKAMRFKLTNSSWRGLRFGFASTVGEAYGAMLPAVALWVLFAAQVATMQPVPGAKPNPGPFFLVMFAFFAAIPALHARIKGYQHRATTCGSQRFEFEPSTGAFYALYGKAFALLLVPIAVGIIVIAAVVATAAVRTGNAETASRPPFLAIGAAYAVFVVGYALVGAYFSARAQQLIWRRTHGGPIRFTTAIGVGKLAGLWFKNGLLTLLTLGLYWPYAAVEIARYQIECMTVHASGPLEALAAGTQQVEPSAAGDGAVDFLGWDFGL